MITFDRYPEGIPTLTAVGPKAAERDQRWTPPEWATDRSPAHVQSALPVRREVTHLASAATRFARRRTAPASLLAEDELGGLRARWDDVQARFVDDPRDCVQRTDGLVAEVIGQLVAGFADARWRLEQQWARGDEATTEDLRIALTRYREFFDRLLAM